MNHWNWNEGKDLLDHSTNSLANADLISTLCSGCSVQSLKDLSNWCLRLFPKGKTFLYKGPQCFPLPSDVSTLKQTNNHKPIYMGHKKSFSDKRKYGYRFPRKQYALGVLLSPFLAFTSGFALRRTGHKYDLWRTS